jgi:hypothetical protein
LRHLLEPAPDQDSGWLFRLLQSWLDSTSAHARRVVFYVGLTLAGVLLAWIVVRELRAAGIGRRGMARAARHHSTVPHSTVESLNLAAIDQAPRAQRLALLLRLLVERLRSNGQLARDQMLTHRELIARATLDNPIQRQRFAQVSLRAERQLYGGVAPDDPALDQVLSEGRALYGELSATRGAAS